MNMLTDIQLCFATFSILFSGESTAGIEEGQTTAMDDFNSIQKTNNEESSINEKRDEK